ncbi:DHHC zinc finger domain-containing protein [Cryptosporidium andersoni]|uniref:Palmitoyltransferase n=1 Tax=Cryptosporidium andersoni TaxID=117008 RepID=A0A1J4MNV3_9CRYT|nr:DHHC zinc finger domain-containing protein [Cryptosporidium andersoni]
MSKNVGNCKLLLNGKFAITPGQNILIVSLVVIFGPYVTFFATVAPWLINHDYYSILVISIMCTVVLIPVFLFASFVNPGIVPQESLNPNKTYIAPSSTTLDIPINGHIFRAKYCISCRVYRSLRSVHCKLCGTCIDRFDHHCPWIGSCIGSGNYRLFLVFISVLSVAEVLLLTGSCIMVLNVVHESKIKSAHSHHGLIFLETMKIAAGAVIVMGFSFFTVIFSSILMFFHCYLCFVNRTTYEQLKHTFTDTSNPWNSGLVRNICEVILGNCIDFSNDYVIGDK